MKIIVKNNNSERQSPEVTIDTSTCHYPYAIREALQLALELDGCDKETIKNVFNLQEDEKTLPIDASGQAEQEGHFEDTTSGFLNAISYLKQVDERMLQLIKPHEIVKHANRIWAKNLQSGGQAEPAQGQSEHFTNDVDGYWAALQWAEDTGNNEMRKLYQDDPNEFLRKANELWKQQNNQ